MGFILLAFGSLEDHRDYILVERTFELLSSKPHQRHLNHFGSITGTLHQTRCSFVCTMSFAALATTSDSQDEKPKLVEQKGRQLQALEAMKEKAAAEVQKLVEDCIYTHSHYKGWPHSNRWFLRHT